MRRAAVKVHGGWFAFQKDILRQRVLNWLEEIGVEPLPPGYRQES